MPQEVDWSSLDNDKQKKSGGGVPFLKFKNGTQVRIRPIGKAVKFYKFFIPSTKKSVVVSVQDKEAAAKMLSEHLDAEIEPQLRYAMYVIDRTDNQIRVLEQGYSVFESFGTWSRATGNSPGGTDGGDWQISASGDGNAGTNPRRYTTVFLGSKPFSTSDKSLVDDAKSKGLLKLAELYKEVPINKLIETAFGKISSPVADDDASNDVMSAVPAGDKDMEW